MSDAHQLTSGTQIRLSSCATSADSFHEDRRAAEKEFRELRDEFISFQARLYAEDRQKLLIIFQAMDAGGKDGTIRKILKGVNPQGVRVTSFKKPSTAELSRDFLWRVHKAVPRRGLIGVFNRSHYEDVLVARVRKLVPESVWQRRYAAINSFEQMLADSGTVILKFFLHISKVEQKERLQDRLDNPDKHWKFDEADLQNRALWDEYQAAVNDMLNKCTTQVAPWHLIPADQKWYRNLAVMRVLVQAARTMNPQYPQSKDLSGIVLE